MRLIIRILTPLALLLAFLVPAGAATAAPAESTRTFSVFTPTNVCNGESTVVQGTLHVVTKSGEIVQSSFHGTGVGSQGNEYILNFHLTDRTSHSGTTFTFNKIVLVSKGSAPNLLSDIRVNPQTGEFTVIVKCNG
jgi:hypothetical protein